MTKTYSCNNVLQRDIDVIMKSKFFFTDAEQIPNAEAFGSQHSWVVPEP